MKNVCAIFLCLASMLINPGCKDPTKTSGRHIIQKENGRIILAYKAFDEFLDTDKSWECYQDLLLDAL